MYKNAGKFFNRSSSRVVQAIRKGSGKTHKPIIDPSTLSPNSATWTKLIDGTWGLRVTGDCSPGMKVRVITRDGRVSDQVIGEILGKSSDYYTCRIADEADLKKFTTRSNSSGPIYTRAKIPIPLDDNSIPFDGPYRRRRRS